MWWRVEDSNLRSFRDGFTDRSHWPLGQPAWCTPAPGGGAEKDSRLLGCPSTRVAAGTGGACRVRRHRKRVASGVRCTARRRAATETTYRSDETVADTSSFDIVSKVDRQEVDNALNQTAKELGQRFD